MSFSRKSALIWLNTLIIIAFLLMTTTSQSDPYLWLEDVDSQNSMTWVEGMNQKSLAKFQHQDPRYNQFRDAALSILQDTRTLPAVERLGDEVYNFWQDATSIRGVYRKTSYQDFRSGNPQWEIILDVDRLAKDENEDWVFKDINCLQPLHQRCLVSLSRGGADAVVTREFDTVTKNFITDGFKVEEAKSRVAWLNDDEIFIATDFGAGTLTDSGYPRQIKRWQRGTTLDQAQLIKEIPSKDVGVWLHSITQGSQSPTVLIYHMRSFFEYEYSLILEDNTTQKINIPDTADLLDATTDHIYFRLATDWQPNAAQATYSSGSVVTIDRSGSTVELVYSPVQGASVDSIAVTKSGVYAHLIHNVKSQLVRWQRNETLNTQGQKEVQWTTNVAPLPGVGSLSGPAADFKTDHLFFKFQSYLTPTTLLEWDGQTKPKELQRLPEYFDSTDLVTEQLWATSKDGTKVPYYIVYNPKVAKKGTMPTILYGYGGFKISLLPSYSALLGQIWLNAGGAYVLANIRGGGEFGPAWHQAALKENRQKAYDDFIAVGEDVIARGFTETKKLGIQGGSNGGLLVGAVMMQRPDLFGAVLCQVPLLDMMRFHLLLAGASWVGEYGSSEDPQMRPIIEKYSPYQNVRDNVNYPPMFLTTSTRDDRVHPGHARKMAALLESKKQPVWLYENTKGGHAGASDSVQKAHLSAIQYSFFFQTLVD